MLGNVTIRVTAAELYQKAESLKTRISRAEAALTEIEETVENMENYWFGEAGEKHRKLYEDQKDKRQELLQRLKGHSENLQSIARIYDDTLPQIQEQFIVPLPGNIIF